MSKNPMTRPRLRWAAMLLCATFPPVHAGVAAAPAPSPPVDPAVLARIRDAAMASDWTYRQLAELTDKIGPRPSGSPAADAAVAQLAQAMRLAGANVSLQPVKATHWVRGEETASLIEYAGRPAGFTQGLHLTALGGSSSTAAEGLSAPLLVVRDFTELLARAAEVPGRIVVFQNRFDQSLADNGYADTAYEQAGEYRFDGPSRAAGLGAAAVLVRSVGGANYRLPHTGITLWKDAQAPIPCAALSAEDADLIDRLAAQGSVTMKLVLTPQHLPDVDSHNLLADLPGRETPDQVVIVSGHIDSWELGTGAIDDGGPMMTAMGAVELLQRLGLRPRRTLRAIGWMDERARRVARSQGLFRIGQGRTRHAGGGHRERLRRWPAAGHPRRGRAGDAQATRTADRGSSPDRSRQTRTSRTAGRVGLRYRPAASRRRAGLRAAGVPAFAPLVDTRHYFDYHHSAADTLDKIDPDTLRRQVAVMAVLAYTLAEMPEPLPQVRTVP